MQLFVILIMLISNCFQIYGDMLLVKLVVDISCTRSIELKAKNRETVGLCNEGIVDIL